MNHILINERAMTTALTALLGTERTQIVKDLYKLLDNTETQAHQEGFKEGYEAGEADGDQDNYYTGYDKGFKDGNDYAFAEVDTTPQPHFYDDYHSEYDGTVDDSLHGTAAALEFTETDDQPTPPADSPF